MPGRRTVKTALLTAAIIFMVLSVFNICLAQAPRNVPDRSNAFKNPDGVPNYINVPNEKGKFANPQKAPRMQGRLMEPSETYPPPGVKRMLAILFVIGLLFFYLIFLRGKMRAIIGFITSFTNKTASDTKSDGKKKLTAKPDESVFSVVCEKASNESILRDMYFSLENEQKAKSEQFGHFSLRSAFTGFSSETIPGLGTGSKGIVIFESDSPALSKAMIFNLITGASKLNTRPILFSFRLSSGEIAEAIINEEMKKNWNQLEESEKYRLQRLSEEFMDKYEAMPVYRDVPITFEQWTHLAGSIKRKHRISAVILDNPPCKENSSVLFENLSIISSKENIPVFVILDEADESGSACWKNCRTAGTFRLEKSADNRISIVNPKNGTLIRKLEMSASSESTGSDKSAAK
ncbi:MAG: hypothetical protein LWY06_04535 [Firmicutes bacterium]|nr:hypothetical protein [Bacillota bacterium]